METGSFHPATNTTDGKVGIGDAVSSLSAEWAGNGIAFIALVICLFEYVMGIHRKPGMAVMSFLVMTTVWVAATSVLVHYGIQESFAVIGIGATVGLVPVFVMLRTMDVHPRLYIQLGLLVGVLLVLMYLTKSPTAMNIALSVIFVAVVLLVALSADTLSRGLSTVVVSMWTSFMLVYLTFHLLFERAFSKLVLKELHDDVAGLYSGHLEYASWQRLVVIAAGTIFRSGCISITTWWRYKRYLRRQAIRNGEIEDDEEPQEATQKEPQKMPRTEQKAPLVVKKPDDANRREVGQVQMAEQNDAAAADLLAIEEETEDDEDDGDEAGDNGDSARKGWC